MKNIISAYRDGGRKYFWHNMCCSSDLLWAITHIIRERKFGSISSLKNAATRKALRDEAIEESRNMFADMAAVINEHSEHNLSDSIAHSLGECEENCGLCDDEWAMHSSSQCDDECSICERLSRGWTYHVDNGWAYEPKTV